MRADWCNSCFRSLFFSKKSTDLVHVVILCWYVHSKVVDILLLKPIAIREWLFYMYFLPVGYP